MSNWKEYISQEEYIKKLEQRNERLRTRLEELELKILFKDVSKKLTFLHEIIVHIREKESDIVAITTDESGDDLHVMGIKGEFLDVIKEFRKKLGEIK